MAFSSVINCAKSLFKPNSMKNLKLLSNYSTKSTNVKIEDFKNLLPTLIQDLTFNGNHRNLPEINQHIAKCIEYNLTDGKLNRGIMVPVSLELLAKPEKFNHELLNQAYVLGWCIEFVSISLDNI